MKHDMDYREHFAHLLEHLVGEFPSDCGKYCPVDDSEHGGISITTFPPSNNPMYKGPSITILLEALTNIEYVVEVKRMGINVYYPTPVGIDYLKMHRHPTGFWLRQNWFPALVAGATIAVPIALKVIDVFFV